MGSQIISNTSPLIALSILGRLNLLWELFDVAYIPKAVYDEIVLPDHIKLFGKADVIQAVQEKEHYCLPSAGSTFGRSIVRQTASRRVGNYCRS